MAVYLQAKSGRQTSGHSLDVWVGQGIHQTTTCMDNIRQYMLEDMHVFKQNRHTG